MWYGINQKLILFLVFNMRGKHKILISLMIMFLARNCLKSFMIRKSCYIKLIQNLKNNVPSLCLIRSTQWQPVWSSASSCNSRDHDSWTVHSRISNVQVRGIGPFSAFLFRSLFPQNLCLNTYQIFCCNRQYVYHIALHHREYIQCMKQVPISGTCCIYRYTAYILHTLTG